MKKKTHEEYVVELAVKNPNVEVVEEYIDSRTKILHRCLIHNIYWSAIPCNVLKGCGCSKCGKDKISNELVKTHSEYVNELRIINPNIIALERYINMKTSILHKCLIHDVEWNTTPDVVMQGCGCKKCKSEKLRNQHLKNNEQYLKDLKKVNLNIAVLDNYIDSKTPILHKCLVDEHEWYSTPTNILSGYGCPKCNESKGEKQIRLWLNSHNVKYESQKIFDDCRDIKPLPFDFYLLEYNLCIEYDGIQHFEPIKRFGGQEYFEYTVQHDNIKNEYCKNNGISLLRIPYFKNVEEELNNFLFI